MLAAGRADDRAATVPRELPSSCFLLALCCTLAPLGFTLKKAQTSQTSRDWQLSCKMNKMGTTKRGACPETQG